MTDASTTRIWSVLSEAFTAILASLEAGMQNVSMASGHSRNDAFPFRAYAQFSCAGHAIVISLDILLEDNQLKIAGDIARGNGVVISDVMQAWVADNPDSEGALLIYANQFASKCKQELSLIANELRRPSEEDTA